MAVKKGGKAEQHGKDDKPRIIYKKVKGHQGGHHGGAWKVAYADFVTAMMALFLVLWLLGATNNKEKAVIAHYFREPGVFSGSRGIIPDGGESKLGAGIIQAPTMDTIHEHIKEGLAGLKDLIDISDQVPITVTDEGILIEMIDKEKQAFFELNSARIKPIMRKILQAISKELKDTSNKLVIAGHTDARGFHDESFYSNWELSAARALNTRRDLEELGLPSERFDQVVGYADRRLRVPNDPLASENRRISILIKKLDKNGAEKLIDRAPAQSGNRAPAPKPAN